jgi:hypothetical protein
VSCFGPSHYGHSEPDTSGSQMLCMVQKNLDGRGRSGVESVRDAESSDFVHAHAEPMATNACTMEDTCCFLPILASVHYSDTTICCGKPATIKQLQCVVMELSRLLQLPSRNYRIRTREPICRICTIPCKHFWSMVHFPVRSTSVCAAEVVSATTC